MDKSKTTFVETKQEKSLSGISKAEGLSKGLFPGVEGLYIPQPAVNPIKLGSVGLEQHSSFNTYD